MVNLAAKIQMADMVASPDEQEQPSGESVAKPAFHWSGFFVFPPWKKLALNGGHHSEPAASGGVFRRARASPV